MAELLTPVNHANFHNSEQMMVDNIDTSLITYLSVGLRNQFVLILQ